MENLSMEVIEKREEFLSLSKNAQASLAYAQGLKIRNDEGQSSAVSNLTKIRDEKDRGDTIRKFFTGPLNEQVKAINAKFQPSIKALEEAERMIRGALADYQNALAIKSEAAKAKVLENVESGKISVEQGVKKIENVKMPEKTVRTEEATISYRIDYRAEVTDEAKVPREYLAPDMDKIQPVAIALHKAGQKQIPGVTVVEVKTPIIRKKQ